MTDKICDGKGAVKKKTEITQKDVEKQRKTSINAYEFSQQDINRIIGMEDKKDTHQQKPLMVSMKQKAISTKTKEVQGGTNNDENQTLYSSNENLNDIENMFIQRKSISHTSTKSGTGTIENNDGPNKRPRSETSPETNSTKRQCEGIEDYSEELPFVDLENESTTTELHILEIISALEEIEKITKQDSEGRLKLTKNDQDNVRDATSFLHRNLTLLVYKLGSLEKENLTLRHKLENIVCEEKRQKIAEKRVEPNKDRKMKQNKKTYANILSSNVHQESNEEKTEEWKTPKTIKKHETIIRVNQIVDSREVIQELRKEINTKNTGGGFKIVKPLRNGAVLVESHSKSQQEQLKTELQNKTNITMKEPQSSNPMFVVTGIEKGFQDMEFIREIIRLNGEIEDELGGDIEKQIRIVVRKPCRNPVKENLVLQAPPLIAKWFLKKELINFDLVKVHIKEYFNLAICFKCSGFGHVAKYCTEKECCHKCGGEHSGRDCLESEWKCPNCEKMKFGLLQHSARDMNCPVYKRRIERFKQNINYNDPFL